MTTLIREHALYIGGEWMPGGGPGGEVENPATEEITGVVTQAGTADVDAAIAADRAAFPGWATTHHNQHRPHRSLHGAAPLKPLPEPADLDQYRVRRHPRVGGMINEYRLVA